LGKSIEALAREQWAGVSIRRLVEIQMSTFGEAAERVELQGDDFVLKAEAVQNLGLVLHELATNSVKYGALSAQRGTVRVAWRILDDRGEDGPILRLTWQERGGPPVREPAQTGFGTTIIKRHAAASFAGEVEVNFLPQGLQWTLTAPWSAFERNEAIDTPADLSA
jgi:two-component sensor histidine kinase